jgi:hypothetical protein
MGSSPHGVGNRRSRIQGAFSNLGLKRAAKGLLGAPSLGRNPNSWTMIEPKEGQSPRRIFDPELYSPRKSEGKQDRPLHDLFTPISRSQGRRCRFNEA